MSGFTPGPWHIERGHDEDCAETETLHICHPGTVCENTTVGQVWNNDEATARLIAAAPELYEALQKARNTLAGCGMAKIAADICDAALAKARGEQ